MSKHNYNGIYEAVFKRPLDIVLSILAILCLSPLFIVLSVIVRIKMGSPIFFKQDRPGKNEKIFQLYKFRTMTTATDENGILLPDDERLTRFGRFLRSTSLDELPELINILKGDMSIVGPRPLLVQYIPLYDETQRRRHEVRPGLTGLAMSKVRNSAGWEKKFELDIIYVDNISFILDLRILIDTVKIVVKREGINEEGYATNSIFRGSSENEDRKTNYVKSSDF